jgi:glycosyltransferase involved in cell wall biosynthesis
MTIAIDCRMINSSGIGSYLAGCLPYFLDSANDFLLFGRPDVISLYCQGKNNYRIFPCGLKTFSLSELFFFPPRLLKLINKCDAYFTPYFNFPYGIHIPIYTTIHDVIFFDVPRLISGFGLFLRRFFFKRAISCSRKIFTVSDFSKSRIQYHFGKNIEIIVTYSAVKPVFLAENSGTAKKKDYILFVGNIKRHKGLLLLLQALSLAKKDGYNFNLKIAGTSENFRTKDNEILKYIDKTMMNYSGNITDNDLKALYAEALLLVQPSFYEGFGLPPLEAMACGTKALVSDIPVFKEIYKDFPVNYFKSGNVLNLKDQIIAVCTQKNDFFTLTNNLKTKYNFNYTSSAILEEISQGKPNE